MKSFMCDRPASLSEQKFWIPVTAFQQVPMLYQAVEQINLIIIFFRSQLLVSELLNTLPG